MVMLCGRHEGAKDVARFIRYSLSLARLAGNTFISAFFWVLLTDYVRQQPIEGFSIITASCQN